MKIVNVTPGLLPIPPNGWGAVEKIIWETHLCLKELGHDSQILYLNQVTDDVDIVHIHVANLANQAHNMGIPYYFTMHDHHAYLYGKDSIVYEENLEAIRNAKRAFVPAKYLVNWFDGIPEYFSHGVNTDFFYKNDKTPNTHKLLCVANNGFIHNQSEDRKGFGIAIEIAKKLDLPITIVGPQNNKKYFEKFPSDYKKLKVVYNVSEEELVKIYREHSIFLHPSVLEAGHPNLTLLEAMACGLPVLATFEDENQLDGLIKIERTSDSIMRGISKIFTSYTEYSEKAIKQAEKLSWKNRTIDLLNKYGINTTIKSYAGKVKDFKIIDTTTNNWNVPITSNDEDFWNGIYSNNKYGWWGNSSKSGEGSEGNAANYKKSILNDIVKNYNVKSIVDFGCGDFNWMSNVSGYEQYVGVDIVKSLIDSHNKNYSNNKRKFIYGNIANVNFHNDFINDNGKSFNLAILFDILGHQLWDEIEQSLNFIINKLDVEYLLVSNMRNCSNPNYWKEKNSRNESVDIEIHPIFKKNGFTIVKEFDNNLILYKLDKKILSMKELLIKHYNETQKLMIPSKQYKPNIVVNNIDGAFIEILGDVQKRYDVKFINKKNNNVEYQLSMSNNNWARCSIKYFVDWKIVVSENGNVVYQYDTDYNGKTVYIALDSKSLGDTLAWFPYVDEFRKKHNCNIICSTFWNDFFESEYPDFKFIKPGEVANGIVAMYTLGIFYDTNDKLDTFKHPMNPIEQPLQKIASDILGLEYCEVKPKMKKFGKRKSEKPYVAIGFHSTAQLKYWNNPTGWQDVCDYLNANGIEPVMISKEGPDYMGNRYPKNVKSIIPKDIEEAIELINGSEFFIGISSGLSWLSWALNKKTILISGFTDDKLEFNDCIRVINKSVCNGCWGRHKFNPGDWNWCPEHKGTAREFECSKSIYSDMVINSIKNLVEK